MSQWTSKWRTARSSEGSQPGVAEDFWCQQSFTKWSREKVAGPFLLLAKGEAFGTVAHWKPLARGHAPHFGPQTHWFWMVLDGFGANGQVHACSVGVQILREDMAKTPGLTRMESGKQMIGVFMGLPLKERLKTQLTLTKARAVVGSLQPLFGERTPGIHHQCALSPVPQQTIDAGQEKKKAMKAQNATGMQSATLREAIECHRAFLLLWPKAWMPPLNRGTKKQQVNV